MYHPSHLHSSRRGSTISVSKKSSLSARMQELLASKELLVLSMLPLPLSGSGLMDDAVVPSNGQLLDDSQATRLNDLDGTEDGLVSSSDNSESSQGNSGFDEEDSLGSFIKDTAGADDDWDCSPSSEVHHH
jgi:hypothetical protein